MNIPADMTNDELVEDIENRFAPNGKTPACRVCGDDMSIQSFGRDGGPTIWGCRAKEPDPEEPGQFRFKKGRKMADDHYIKSRYIVPQQSDPVVSELLRRFKRLIG
jgi:hypothetical protein